MAEYGGFPMSIIVVGFFVTSLAYLICFCCCIVQFFIRRGRELSVANQTQPTTGIDGIKIGQKNDTLKESFVRKFRNSLRRFRKNVGVTSLPSELDTRDFCPICFDEYKGDPAEILIGIMKRCEHYFHFDCIWTWLETRGNCPLCRKGVSLTEEDVKAVALRHILDQHLHRNDDGLDHRANNNKTEPNDITDIHIHENLELKEEAILEEGQDNLGYCNDEHEVSYNEHVLEEEGSIPMSVSVPVDIHREDASSTHQQANQNQELPSSAEMTFV